MLVQKSLKLLYNYRNETLTIHNCLAVGPHVNEQWENGSHAIHPSVYKHIAQQ
jgi:hypothetical protein